MFFNVSAKKISYFEKYLHSGIINQQTVRLFIIYDCILNQTLKNKMNVKEMHKCKNPV